MIQCPAEISWRMMTAMPRTSCWSTNFRWSDSIGMLGAVQMIMAGARTPTTKKVTPIRVREKRTGRVVTRRSRATDPAA